MTIVTRSGKGNALSHTELDGNFTHLAGDGTYQFPSTKGTTKQVLRMNSGATALEFVTVNTDDVAEGSSNLYFTNTRADARISAVVTQPFVDALYTGIAPQNSFEIKTASFNTANAKRYMVDTTGGVVTATLPASPSAGNTIEFTNGAQNFATNNLVIARNGSTINGASSNLTVSENPIGGILTLVYDGSTWRSDPTTVPEKSFSIQTSNFNAVSGTRYGIDTSSNTVTATLPGSPSTGDAIFFADAGGNYATNKLTLGRNGNTIMGSASDMDVTTNNQSVGVFYNGTTWRIY